MISQQLIVTQWNAASNQSNNRASEIFLKHSVHYCSATPVESHRCVSVSSQPADQDDTSQALHCRWSTAEQQTAAAATNTSPANQQMLPLTYCQLCNKIHYNNQLHDTHTLKGSSRIKPEIPVLMLRVSPAIWHHTVLHATQHKWTIHNIITFSSWAFAVASPSAWNSWPTACYSA